MEGLNHSEIRHLTEKIGEQPEHQADTEKLAEFSVPSWLVSSRVESKITNQAPSMIYTCSNVSDFSPCQ